MLSRSTVEWLAAKVKTATNLTGLHAVDTWLIWMHRAKNFTRPDIHRTFFPRDGLRLLNRGDRRCMAVVVVVGNAMVPHERNLGILVCCCPPNLKRETASDNPEGGMDVVITAGSYDQATTLQWHIQREAHPREQVNPRKVSKSDSSQRPAF